MGKYFDDIHASWQSQLCGAAVETEDSAAVTAARAAAGTAEGLSALGDALTKQLRYREAAEAYDEALKLSPDDLSLLRRRAGRYISTLQCEKALEDLAKCAALGADCLDILYRTGLCRYFMRQYAAAREIFSDCIELCDDEMGIAVIYWHTLCSYRLKKPAELLKRYRTGMAVGHHTAYEKAVSVFAGVNGFDAVYAEALAERDDLESVIILYGLHGYAMSLNDASRAQSIMEQILPRDGFWPSYAYLAALNDSYGITK